MVPSFPLANIVATSMQTVSQTSSGVHSSRHTNETGHRPGHSHTQPHAATHSHTQPHTATHSYYTHDNNKIEWARRMTRINITL